MRKRPFVFAAALIAAGAAAFGVVAFRDTSKAASSPPTPAAVPVVAGTVLSHDVPIYLRGLGTVIPYNNVVVRSQITGQIIKITFTQGQAVHRGDLLAEIDPRPYQAQLDQAIANRDRDQAQVGNAEANLERYESLAKNGYASTQLVDTTKTQLAQLQAMVKSDEGVIEQAQTNLSYTKLTAPIDGVTGIRQVDEGNIIHPSDANGLVYVTQIQPISLIFTLPQTSFVEIQQQMANGPLKVLAYSQDDKTELDQGKLDLIDNQIIQTTGTIRLRASFPNTRHMLWPGELVNARLLLKTQHDGLTIPSMAVQLGPNGPYVWVIGGDGRVQTRAVKLFQLGDGQVLVTSGLQANEKIVVDGQYRLQPGALVQELHGKAAENANLQSSVEQAIP